MGGKTVANNDISTEEKIIMAARQIFTKKGYAATRTRDIAEAAGINLALLNYYFRSKEKLFEQIMREKVQQLFGSLLPVLKDPSTNLDTKVKLIVSNYIEMISENPDLPLFVLNELRSPTSHINEVLPIDKIIPNSSFFIQLKEKRPDINPLHFLLNILGMTVFPFIASPALNAIGIVTTKDFKALTKEREVLIPLWTKAMLKAK